MRYTEKDLLRMQAAGTIRSYKITGKQVDKPKKQAKYRNHKVIWERMTFDSRKEYKRYRELLLQEKAGVIKDLRRQVSYDLIVNGQLVARYIADHDYTETDTGQQVVEDVKSIATRKLAPYRLKRKLMKSIYNITIKEV